MRSPLPAVLAVVAVLALLGSRHGLPQRYVPDDHAVRCALGIARDLGDPALPKLVALVPPAGQYTTYPYLLPYLDLAAIGASYAGGRLAGAWHGAGEFAERVFEDPTPAWWPARLVGVLLSLLAPLGVWLAARELGWGAPRAALAALLAGSSLLMVQFAKTERPWAPLVAFFALALAFSLRLRRRPDGRTCLAAGLAAGLAAATHPVGAAAFGLPVLGGLLFRPGVRRLLSGLAGGVLLALLVGYPYLLVYREDTGAGAITGQLDAGTAVEIGGQAFDLTRFAGQHAARVARSWLAYDPVLVLGGLTGLALLLRARVGRPAVLLALPVLGLTVLFLLYDGSHVRYLMPTVPFLALGAAWALGELARRGPAPRALAALLVALPLVQAARLDQLLGREDTRTEAARRIEQISSPRDVIAVDGYEPPLLPTAASVERAAAEVWVSRAERRVVEQRDAGLPEPARARDLLPVSRYYRYLSYYPTDYVASDSPRELGDLFDARGVTLYCQVDRLPREEPRAPVDALVARRGTLVLELSPTGAGNPPEAALPTEMSCALLDVWRYERPGPWIRVWHVARAAR